MQVKDKCPGWDLGQTLGLPRSLWTMSLLNSAIALASTTVVVWAVVALLLPFPSLNWQTPLAR